MTEFVSTSLTVVPELRGKGISKDLRDIAGPLISQAFALQRNFEIAEDSACMLEEMLREDADSAAAAVDRTWEGNSFVHLREQLFRVLIIDLHASVLDNAKGNGSVAAILKRLRGHPKAIPALRAFCRDTGAMRVEVSGLSDPAEVTRRVRAEIEHAATYNGEVFDTQWARIQTCQSLLEDVQAQRLSWSRSKAIAHFERTATGLVFLHDAPPFGSGPLGWREPIDFLESVRPFVYDVFSLVTSNSWSGGGVAKMYARAFWDRFKNGRTDVGPGNFKAITDEE